MKAFLLTILLAPLAFGLDMVKTKEFTYEVDGEKFQGFVANGAPEGKKVPGILIVHEWWGHTDFVQEKAKQLAEQGYVAMAIDMFGKGKTADHPKKAKEFAQAALKDMDSAQKKFEKALSELKARKDVADDKIAAIGFCFGGGVALQMAARGVDLDLVASFHGSLPPANFAMPKMEDAPVIMVFNGAADPMISKDQIRNFANQMKEAEVKYIFVSYPGVKHAFTNPKATELGKKFELPLEYDEKAAKDSWQKFLAELKKL